MIRIYLILSLIAGAVLYRFPAVRYDSAPALTVECRDFTEAGSYQTLRDEKGPVFYNQRGSRVPLSSDRLYFVPPLGSGYFEYQKIGKEIAYYAHPDELYWRRESASYPVSDPEGRWILLISGDLTSVRLMDHNGNAASGPPLAGMLLTDYAFCLFCRFRSLQDSGKEDALAAAVLFSSGPLYIVRFEPDFRIFTLNIPDSERAFAKSVATAGDRIAIHLQQDDQDFIRQYRLDEKKERLEEIESVKLPFVVAHRMPLALTDSGVLFATSRFAGQIENGSISWMGNGRGGTDFEAGIPGVEFQGDALTTGVLSMAGGQDFLYFLVRQGEEVLPVATALRQGSPYRFLPHTAGITMEDDKGYCTIRPSAVRK